LDGKEGPEFDEISERSLTFSPDSRRMAYLGMIGIQGMVVVDGKAGRAFDRIAGDSLVFSPHSRHIAYLAARDRQVLLMVDNVEGPAFDWPVKGPPGYGSGLTPAFTEHNKISIAGPRFDKSYKKEIVHLEVQILED